MTTLKVLIVAKTRRAAGACIGAITPEGRSLRLVAANAATDERAGLEYNVGEVWEIEAAPDAALVPPHVENVIVIHKRCLGFRTDVAQLIEQRMPPVEGDVTLLYVGLTHHTASGRMYIAHGAALPAYSTCFWRPDRPLQRELDAVRIRYRYPTADGGRTLTFVGFQEPPEELPAGAILRVSLAHWWRPDEKPDEELRCYVQLSGWFLPGEVLQPPGDISYENQRRVVAVAPATNGAEPAPPSADLTDARRLLKQVFGYDSFRPLQAEIISSLLRGRDALAILPTGGGKSLCYQLPALLWNGLTLVVSPLISLMQDQVDAMRQLGVPAVFLNSSVRYADYMTTMEQIRAGAIKLLYVAPETLLRPEILALLDQAHVDCITIDEAHCISQWGHDFRPEYRQLEPIRRRYPQAVCLALTATAAPRVQRDIQQTLGMAGNSRFVASFDRNNLYLAAQPRTQGIQQLKAFLSEHPQQSGIIYCNTRRQVEVLVRQLVSMGHRALAYHAGLEDQLRARNQRAFVRDEVEIIVATVAFGMGINKSNVRFVVHYELPPSLEHYYQEIGRAGRDGLPADCLLLYSRQDMMAHMAHIDEGAEHERAGRQARLQAMMRYAEADECRRKPLLAYFGETYAADQCACCDFCQHGAQPGPVVDITAHAVKLLACVLQTNQRFGITHVVLVLRGSGAKNVLRFHHDRLPEYGAGADLPEKSWKSLAQQLIQQRLLVQDMEHGTLALTEKGHAVLHGDLPVQGVLELETPSLKRQTVQQNYEIGLFEALRQWRRTTAEQANVPPYVIFSDRTLVEISIMLPRTEQMLLVINGIGEAKLARYGEALLGLVRTYCDEHGIGDPADPMQSLPTTPPVGQRTQEIADLLISGVTIPALQEIYGVRLGTILRHVYLYVAAGGQVDPAALLAVSKLTAEQQQQVMDAFGRFDSGALTPVFEYFGGRIDYDELRLIRTVRHLRAAAQPQ